MPYIELTEPIPDLKCRYCGKEYQYDPVSGWGCIILADETRIPTRIVAAWCNLTCLQEDRFTEESLFQEGG